MQNWSLCFKRLLQWKSKNLHSKSDWTFLLGRTLLVRRKRGSCHIFFRLQSKVRLLSKSRNLLRWSWKDFFGWWICETYSSKILTAQLTSSPQPTFLKNFVWLLKKSKSMCQWFGIQMPMKQLKTSEKSESLWTFFCRTSNMRQTNLDKNFLVARIIFPMLSQPLKKCAKKKATCLKMDFSNEGW